MSGLENIDKQIYYTYHSKKNKEALPVVYFFSVFAMICNCFIIGEIIIWTIYSIYCNKNNEELNRDPENLERRKFLLEFREKIVRGEIQFKEPRIRRY